MTLLEQIQSDLNQALRAGETLTVSTLRLVKSELQNATIASQGDLSPEAASGVVRKEVKKRTESAAMFATAGHADRAASETAEAEILKKYLPAAASDEDILAKARQLLAVQTERTPRAKGEIIKGLKETFGEQIDGATAARITDLVLSEA